MLMLLSRLIWPKKIFCFINKCSFSQSSGSEFSDSWGKRGEGGQGREGVQLPDSLLDEAVFQSVCPGLETPQSPP